ncbi:hypothetical protein CK203_033008 [Vitis vinifera]|uniref:GAG-pre-integrase domain-containing protein n=1 Tax=Vitis vinifera TaxID=29760 RepID=A0A438HVU6_VITVI|nr:hypothetical protein CK203_033008 [Vitis vinifera]
MLSGQSYRGQKTLITINIFSATFFLAIFSNTDHIIRSAKRRSATFLKAPEPKTNPRASHEPFFSDGLNSTRWRVRARGPLLVPSFYQQARSAPSCTSKPPLVLSKPCFSIFLAFQPPRIFFQPPTASNGSSLPWPRPMCALGRPLLHLQSPTITLEKLIGSENYLSWSASVELWFMGQGYEDHLVTPEDAIPDVDKVQWKKINAQLCNVLWQSIDPKILHHLRAYKTCFKFWTQAKGLYTNDIQRFYKVVSDIVHVRQQDMDLSTYIGRIASLKEEFLTLMPFTNGAEAQQIQTDKFFMVLTLISLRPILNSSVLASQTNSRGGRSGNRGRGRCPQCTYCNKLGHTRDRCYQLHGRCPRTAHIAQSSDPLLSRPDSAASSTSQSITLTGSDYDAYLRYQAATSASVAQTGNVSVYFTQSPSLGPWILDSRAFDHISGIGLAHPLPSLPLHSDRSTEKTIGIRRESQGLYHLTSPSSPATCISTYAPLLIHSRLGHPSLSKFQKMRLNNRAKSPFELVHTAVWGPCQTASTLGFRYFVTFIDDYSR